MNRTLPPNKVAVAAYLPVLLKTRGRQYTEWWRVFLTKDRGFEWRDCEPFCVRESDAETGQIFHQFDFQIESIDFLRLQLVCRPYGIAMSKAWPLERTLLGCGWERCQKPDSPERCTLWPECDGTCECKRTGWIPPQEAS
jgi:hypothetical protein